MRLRNISITWSCYTASHLIGYVLVSTQCLANRIYQSGSFRSLTGYLRFSRIIAAGVSSEAIPWAMWSSPVSLEVVLVPLLWVLVQQKRGSIYSCCCPCSSTASSSRVRPALLSATILWSSLFATESGGTTLCLVSFISTSMLVSPSINVIILFQHGLGLKLLTRCCQICLIRVAWLLAMKAVSAVSCWLCSLSCKGHLNDVGLFQMAPHLVLPFAVVPFPSRYSQIPEPNQDPSK